MAAESFENTGESQQQEGEKWFLRMRGLPWSSSIKDIQEFFSTVTLQEDDVNILSMPDGRASGEALVACNTQEDYEKCMTFEKEHMETRYIELYPSSAEEWDRVSSRTNRVLNVPIKQGSFLLLMRGLPFSAHEDDCIAFFEGVPCLGVHLPKDSLGRPSGQGFAEFETREQIQSALKFNKKTMSTRYIELFESTVADLLRAMQPGAVERPGQRNRNKEAGMFQYNPAMPGRFPGQQDRNPYVTSVVTPKPFCIKMRGMPFDTTEHEITQFFQEQSVTPLRIHRKADGAEAFVEFGTRPEFDDAMKQDKAFMDRRYVELFPVDFNEVAEKVGLPQQQTFRGPPASSWGQGAGVKQNPYERRFTPDWDCNNCGATKCFGSKPNCFKCGAVNPNAPSSSQANRYHPYAKRW